MAHRVYRIEQGNGYATRTIDTWAKAEPVITVFWFLDPPRMHRITRSAAAQQLMEQRRAGLPITRNVVEEG